MHGVWIGFGSATMLEHDFTMDVQLSFTSVGIVQGW